MTTANTITQSVKYGLYFAASWPGAPFSILHKLFWTILFSSLHISQYSYLILHYKYNALTEIIDNISICLPFSLVCIKLFTAWTQNT